MTKKKTKAVPPFISQGSMGLKACGRSLSQIARETGCSYVQAGQWVSGHRKPSDKWRPILAQHYKIAWQSWDEPIPEISGLLSRIARGPDPNPAARIKFLAPPARDADRTTTRGTAERMIKQIQDELDKIPADPLMTPDERAKAYARNASTLAAVARLTGEAGDIPEAKIMRTPAWGRIRDAMIAALSPWPEALRAVGEAVARLES